MASYLLRRIPHLLLAARVVLGPVLLIGGWAGWPGAALFGLLGAATLTDIFDGIIARRLGVATERLRRADSLADTAFYLCVGVLVVVRYPAVVAAYGPGLGAIVLLEGSRAVLDHYKFGRQAAYHMWSAKAWGLALLLGFSELFLTGDAGVFFALAIGLGILTDAEGLAASFVLPAWRHDVPSLFHALRLRRALGTPPR